MKQLFAVYIISKVYLNTLLRMLKNSFIEIIWRRRLKGKYRAPEYLKRKNILFQKKFGNIFAGYDICRTCISHCCHSRVNRYDFVDCYVNDLALDDGRSPWHRIPHLFSAVEDLLYPVRPATDDSSAENCIHYSPSTGCLLPIGFRPWMCVAGTCYKLLSGFSVRDLSFYSALLTRYSLFHIRCYVHLLRALVKGSMSGDERSGPD